jgi:hypothetical protein
MRFRRVFRLIEIKKKAVSSRILPADSKAVRAGHVKVTQDAKIGTQIVADQSDRSARVEAH